jgi:hypothetical protein
MKWLGLGCGGLILAGLAAAVIGGIALFKYASQVQSEGAAKEANLSAQYSKDQNEYSNYGASVVESLGVAETKMDKVKELVVAYVSGRKVEGSGKLVTAVAEAVPDLGSAAIYDKIVDAVIEGRKKFKDQQDKMLDAIRDYETWSNSGLIRPMCLRWYGFPTHNLRATIGGQDFYGQEALSKMRSIVTTAQTQRVFMTGIDEPVIQPRGTKK